MKLKHLLTVVLCFMCSAVVFGQYPMDSLKITVQGPLLFPGNDAKCDLTGSTKYYLHSGVGDNSSQSSPFTNVTGNWGMDDGVGEMSPTGNLDEWSITVHVVDYYGADPATDTAMGLVIRSEDGSKEGKDSSCMDIFSRNLLDMTPTAEGSSGNPFSFVTFEWVGGTTSVRDINKSISASSVFPNPVIESATIAYTLSEKADHISIKVFNALGSEVATLLNDQSKPSGSYRVTWDCNDQHGDAIDSGVYFYVISADESVLTNRMMVVR